VELTHESSWELTARRRNGRKNLSEGRVVRSNQTTINTTRDTVNKKNVLHNLMRLLPVGSGGNNVTLEAAKFGDSAKTLEH